MTYKNFADYIRTQTGTNSSTFPNDKLLLYANIYKDMLAQRIVRTKQDIFGVPEVTDLAVNLNGSPQREYPLDESTIQQVKHVEAKLDGVNWLPLEEMDLTGYTGANDEATITTRFTNTPGNCFYDLFRKALFIYSGTFGAVAGGLKIWTFQWPADIADLTSIVDMSVDPTGVSAGFPREFHELLARRVIIARKTEGDKPLQLTDNEKKFEIDLATALNDISDHSPILAALPDENRYDNGFNL